MYLLVLFLPFISAFFYLTFGNYLGIKGVQEIIKYKLLILIILASLIIYEIYFLGSTIEIEIYEWIFNGVYICFLFDFYSSILLFLIIIIFSVVILYSIWYMQEDPHIIRFIGFLTIFTFMMILLVVSKNSLTMFIGWEGVGITSYLLINFWYSIIQANKSAIKAIIYNKVGDIFFMLGVIMTIIYNNNLNFNHIYIYLIEDKIIYWIILFFLIAAMAKSAQILFDSWLGDAMMGPTPVSALLHAATMVTAGIYLLMRILPSYILPYEIVILGSFIGLMTIILGGFIALFQNDMKKIIAYSTCSQLGYMFYSLFIGIPINSYFHLFIHGFFKGLLFLSAGIIIHNIALNQDSRKISSLLYIMPLSYIFFLIGTLSIISWPFYSGFYSKEPIISISFLTQHSFYVLSVIGALLTISYSFKLFFTIFLGRPTNYVRNFIIKEPIFLTFFFLIFGSLFIGYLAIPSFFITFFINFELEFLPINIKIIPLILIPIGMFIGYFFNKIYTVSIKYSIEYFIPLYTLFNKRFFFENIYNNTIKIIYMNKIYKYIDNGILDISSFLKRPFLL